MEIPSPRSKKRARIEIIPLIDIMFFLLATFLMVSLSMIKNNGLSVRLPTAESSTPQPVKDEVASITLSADGTVYFNKEAVAPETLKERLHGLKEKSPEPRVRIQGDERASLGAAVSVLDMVRSQGIEKISIVTRPASTP